MDDLIADFVAEGGEMLDALGGEIVAWEATPDDRARLDSIFRFVHTVKGNCGFFDFPRLSAPTPARGARPARARGAPAAARPMVRWSAQSSASSTVLVRWSLRSRRARNCRRATMGR